MQAQSCLNNHREDVEALEGWIARLQENDRYRMLDDEHGRPFRNWHHFCVARQPFGLGYSPDAIEQLVRERRRAQELAADPKTTPLDAHGGQRQRRQATSPEGGPTAEPSSLRTGSEDDPSGEIGQGSLATLVPDKRDRGAEYLVRRLKRDAPEVAQALARGEFPSARAAGIAAGIVRNPTIVQKAIRLVERMQAAERLEFAKAITPLIMDAENEQREKL